MKDSAAKFKPKISWKQGPGFDFRVGDPEKRYVLVGMSYLFVTNSLLGLQNSLLANFKRKNFACKWAVQAEAPGLSRHTSGG